MPTTHALKTPIFLSRPSLITSGGDTQNLLDNLFTQKRFFNKENSFYLGRINTNSFTKIPHTMPKVYHTRTNLLAYYTLLELQDYIELAKSKFKSHKIGVVIGSTTVGIGENYQAFKKLAKTGTFDTNLYFNERSSLGSVAEFVKKILELRGVSFGVSTACTSGTKAIIEAARLVENGICDAVICGGSESLNELTIAGFASLEILSQNLSNPFCANRDGINLGEASCLFLLTKEQLLEDSTQLKAYCSNNDAFHFTAPNPDATQQKKIITQCLKMANLQSVDYINLHATGTQENDKMEARAINSTAPNTPCSGQKSQIGHTLAAAGALGLGICSLLLLRDYKRLPPQVYNGELDKTLEPINLVTQTTPPLATPLQTALSLSFAFGGDNAGVILQKI